MPFLNKEKWYPTKKPNEIKNTRDIPNTIIIEIHSSIA